jgi:hypothetical protein
MKMTLSDKGCDFEISHIRRRRICFRNGYVAASLMRIIYLNLIKYITFQKENHKVNFNKHINYGKYKNV